jgi:hypothetical protein
MRPPALWAPSRLEANEWDDGRPQCRRAGPRKRLTSEVPDALPELPRLPPHHLQQAQGDPAAALHTLRRAAWRARAIAIRVEPPRRNLGVPRVRARIARNRTYLLRSAAVCRFHSASTCLLLLGAEPLLPQPYGFPGLGAVEEELDPRARSHVLPTLGLRAPDRLRARPW